MSAKQKRHEMLERMASEAYAQHVLKRAAPDRWLFKREGSGTFWAEVVTCAGGRLVIVGDGPDLIFWGGGCTGEEQVRWAATAEIDYLAGKVQAWRNNRNGMEWDEDVALDQVRREIAEAESREMDEDGDIDEGAAKDAREWREVLDAYRSSYTGEHEFSRVVYEITNDPEYDFGRVVASDVYYARAAFRRLAELLDAPAAPTVPP